MIEAGRAMQRTRRVILDYLKRNPGATLVQLATAAGIVPITARSHVAVLLEDGLLRTVDVRGPRGRPHHCYYLTDAAEAYFPKQYDALAVSLLSSVAQLEGERGLNTLLDHVAGQMAAPYLPRVQGKPLPVRLPVVASMITERGGVADWARTDEGYVVREHNCPYPSASRCSDHVCEIDRRLVEKLTGAPVTVTQRMRDGAESCTFVIPNSGK
jgi:predicted ArsR family transcriptional regulator